MIWTASARRFGSASFALALVGFAADARAEPSKEECISANESAQTLLQSRKLIAARTQLRICVASSCPAAVRADCADRLSEVEKAIPSIVFTAKGPDGADLTDVKVTIDGSPLADRLDGSALSVDPGEHTFELTTNGYASISKKLMIPEGLRGRQEAIAFVAAGAPRSDNAPVATSEPAIAEGQGNGRRTIAYILGGAGIVGLGIGTYLGLRANSTYDSATSHCPSGPSSCDATGVSEGQDAHSQATGATIGFIAGAALLAGGVIVFLTAPKSGAVSVQAAGNVAGAGIRIGGAW